MRTREQLKAAIARLEVELLKMDGVDKLSVRQIAKLADISIPTAHRVKQGKIVKLETARKVLPLLSKCPCCDRILKE